MRISGLALAVGLGLTAAPGCASDADGGSTTACVPGQQTECACPGAAKGAQVCSADGTSLGPCDCGAGGSGGGGGWPSGGSAGTASGGSAGAGTGGSAGAGTGGSGGACPANHCQDGTKNCAEQDVDCGGGCAPCPYVLADCIESPKNGSEICDDQAWQVQSPGKPLVLVCLDGNGGTIYVASNTGPVMQDGIARCQGWETNQQNAWDHLSYLFKLECDAAQKTLDVDLSDRIGDVVYMGVHDKPTGGGHNTQSCFAWKK